MKNKILFALDIGGSKAVALVGSVFEKVEVHGVSCNYFTNTAQNNEFFAMNQGHITNLDLITSKVTKVLNEARAMANCSAGGVVCSINGVSVKNIYSKSKINCTNEPIGSLKLTKLIDEATNMAVVPMHHQILDYEVQEYLLNNKSYTINPSGLVADTLEANINLFIADQNQAVNMQKAINGSGFKLAKFIPSSILTGMSVLVAEDKSIGCCLLDIGFTTTDLVIYEGGFVRALFTIPIGSEHITQDIAKVLKISRNLAEDIKLNYGVAMQDKLQANENISITDHAGNNLSFSHKLIISVINMRVKELFDLVKSYLSTNKIYDIISSGIIITGGGSLLAHIDEYAHKFFNLPVRLGLPHYSGPYKEIVVSPKYATSLGTLYFAHEYMLTEMQEYGSNLDTNVLKYISTKFIRLFK